MNLINRMFCFVFQSGVRKPPVPFGANGRSISGSVVPSSTANRNMSTPPDPKQFERDSPLSIYNSKRKLIVLGS